MLDSTLKNACILLVDDQPSNLAMLENLLAREGYVHLKSVDDSRQFFSAFEEFQPDIILLDLHMPHLDGFAIMEGLRERIPAGEYLPSWSSPPTSRPKPNCARLAWAPATSSPSRSTWQKPACA